MYLADTIAGSAMLRSTDIEVVFFCFSDGAYANCLANIQLVSLFMHLFVMTTNLFIYIYTTLGNYSDLLDRKRNAHAFVPKLEMIF